MADLALVADLKTWLGISVSTYDTPLERVLDSVDKTLARRLGRPYLEDGTGGWLTNTHVEYLDGNDGPVLYLAHTPIDSITSVVIVTGASSTSTIASTLYTFDPDSGALHYYESEGLSLAAFQNPDLNTGRFPRGIRNVKATYVGGYANQAAVPGDLEQLAIELAADVWRAKGRDTNLTSESIGGYSYTLTAPGGPYSARLEALSLGYMTGGGVV